MKDKKTNRGARYREVIIEESGAGPGQEQAPELPGPPIRIRVVNGHLRYAKHPVVIGHFKGDGIVSAEKVLDHLLDRKLSERLQVGLYPGEIDSQLVLLPDGKNNLGAIIVGLGEPEELTPFLLRRTIELGCVDYLLKVRDKEHASQAGTVGISSLLVGSAYGYLSLSNSINAIIEGVINANRKIRELDPGLPAIVEVEFIELYEEKALNAFFFLHETITSQKLAGVALEHPLRKVEGARTFVPLLDEREWWKRITVQVTDEENGQAPYLNFSASTGRAKVEVRALFTNRQMIQALLSESSMRSAWDRELSRTIFELLIPNDFKISFKNQQNILLILDKSTAWYPWELLHPEEDVRAPICVSAGMIRQLSTSDDRSKIKPVRNNKALIIGDPIVETSGLPQLPGAQEEALAVEKLLQKNGYQTISKIRESPVDMLTRLFSDYKVIHIASHGVVDYGPDKKSGILLSGDIVLSPAEINQIRTTPELVFINACYMGEIDPAKEKHFRARFRIAANIGTQLIENGVKAVVVAGWAVHDAAAKLFAAEFYTGMLAGETFAEAVKAARKKCYEKYPETNTWGAYQCYGDPFYQLEAKRKRADGGQDYILDKEILIDLEILINDARSSRKRTDNLQDRLREISRKIDRSGLRSGYITEMEATAYAELLDFPTAIEKFALMQTAGKADYSVSALEQWCNLRAQYLVSRMGEEDSAGLASKMDEVITDLQQLLNFGKTSERWSLLGSAYKRKSMLLMDEPARRKALTAMADSYKNAFVHDNKDLKKNRIYPLTNWIIAETLLENGKRIASVKKLLGVPVENFLDREKERCEKAVIERNDFWDLIAVININQCELLFAKTEAELQVVRDDIERGYGQAWKLGGSFKQKNSEMVHMLFIRDTLSGLGQKGTPRYMSIEELIDFFEAIE